MCVILFIKCVNVCEIDDDDSMNKTKNKVGFLLILTIQTYNMTPSYAQHARYVNNGKHYSVGANMLTD